MVSETCTMRLPALAVLAAAWCLAGPSEQGPDDPPPKPEQHEASSDDSQVIPEGLGCLLAAYPDLLESATENELVWKDGTVMLYDDGLGEKDFETLLNSPDLEDQMSFRYEAGRDYTLPIPENHDPGRVRYEPFFRKMYGDSRKAVAATLGEIRWLPGTVNKRIKVTTVNGVHEKLQAVSEEMEQLPKEIRKFAEETSGSFVWRKIGGTDRLSMHSFAIAIDVGVEYSNYWKWDKPDKEGKRKYRNRIPLEIVEVFERHGFIWGGKWYHYDTMHFEYRPEYLVPPCVIRKQTCSP